MLFAACLSHHFACSPHCQEFPPLLAHISLQQQWGETFGQIVHEVLPHPFTSGKPAKSATMPAFTGPYDPELHKTISSVGASGPIPGYRGHIPGLRQEAGATYAQSGLRAASTHAQHQAHLRSREADLSSTKALQPRLQEIPPGERAPPRIHSAPPQFTHRVYTRTLGTVPHSTIHQPQRRHRDAGQTYGAASRHAAHLVHDCNEPRTSSSVALLGDRTHNSTQPLFPRPARSKQWIV